MPSDVSVERPGRDPPTAAIILPRVPSCWRKATLKLKQERVLSLRGIRYYLHRIDAGSALAIVTAKTYAWYLVKNNPRIICSTRDQT